MQKGNKDVNEKGKNNLIVIVAFLLFSILIAITYEIGMRNTSSRSKATGNIELDIKKSAIVEEEEELPDFKTECEENAKEHPAMAGAILVTKGDYNFTGMKYYFKGEIVEIGLIENDVGDSSTWFVKNENGYVMPIQHDRFNAEIGDEVEVWGTLSGNGYSTLKGVDNVVGETGSMHAFMVTVNGEEQY